MPPTQSPPSDTSNHLLKVNVSADLPHQGFEKFSPGERMQWGRIQFHFNPPPEEACDFWIIYTACQSTETAICAPENTLFIAGEPPTKKVYPKGFYAQFHQIVSCNPNDPHPRVTNSMLGLPWMVGWDNQTLSYNYGYDELSEMPVTAKENKISVVCSNLRTTDGQRKRLEFLDALKEKFGDQIVHFGRGFQSIDDKMDAIKPFRFHLVLENSQIDHYWTEKLADSYLGRAFPFYLGAPNILDYFPAEGIQPVNPANLEETISLMEQRLNSDFTSDERHCIEACRDEVLNRYNPFAQMAQWVEKFYREDCEAKLLTIHSHRWFRSFPRGLIYRWKNRA